MNVSSEKELYKDRLKAVERRVQTDIFVWGEDLLDKKLILYPKKLKEISGYQEVKAYLALCGIVLVDPAKKDLLRCITAMIDRRTGNIYCCESGFNGVWKLLKESLNRSMRIALQNGECPISKPEDILVLDHLMRPGSVPTLVKDRIQYVQRELTQEERYRNSRKQSLLDNPRMFYFYAEGGRYFHDKNCEEVKSILPEQFRASASIPDKEMCPKCRRTMYLRKACYSNTKQMPICNKILTEHKINNRKLHHFIIDAGLKFHARTVEEMQVEGAEDKWEVKGLKNEKMELWHNNYVRTSSTERYITEGYHKQKVEGQTLAQVLNYIENYSFAKHLQHEKAESKAVSQNGGIALESRNIPEGNDRQPATAAWHTRFWDFLKKLASFFRYRD